MTRAQRAGASWSVWHGSQGTARCGSVRHGGAGPRKGFGPVLEAPDRMVKQIINQPEG
jgi:hypothetical protein